MESTNYTGLIIFIFAAYAIISFFVIRAFFRMAEDLSVIKEKVNKDLKIIKETLIKEPKVENLSIYKLLEGKKKKQLQKLESHLLQNAL